MIPYAKYSDADLAKHYQDVLATIPTAAELMPGETRITPDGKMYITIMPDATTGLPVTAEVEATVIIEHRGQYAASAAIEAAVLAHKPSWLDGSSQPITIKDISREPDRQSEDRAVETTITLTAQWSEYNSTK